MQSNKATFVLLHGAWHGGWCWEPVAAILRQRGHRVTTPTQTGLGERAHLLSADISLSTFVDDLVNHIHFERLENVVLVGHSFGGCTITGVAHRMADRVDRLIYLDALIPISGNPPMAEVPDAVAEQRIADAGAFSGGVSMPCPKARVFDVRDPQQAAWVEARLTPHPLKTYLSSISFDGRPDNGLPASYIICTDPHYAPLDASRRRVRELELPISEIATGHDAMVSAPLALADLLERSL